MMTLANMTTTVYLANLPIILLGLGTLINILQYSFKHITKKESVFFLQISILSVCFVISLSQTATSAYLDDAYTFSKLSQFGQLFILGIGIITSLLFKSHILEKKFFRVEISSIYQMVLLGMLVIISSINLITIYIGLEISSLGLYTLIGYTSQNRASIEGSLKYLILGSFSSAFLLFGFGLLYLSFGTLNLAEMITRLHHYNEFKTWINTAFLLVLVGLAFKLALFPFHMWAPDAYEAAPTGITAFMATTMKVVIIIILIRFSIISFKTSFHQWLSALFFMSASSILVGNGLALVQTNIKRTLAYSAIAHSGYLAIGLFTMGSEQLSSYQAVLFYLIVYCMTSLLAFAGLMFLEQRHKQDIHLYQIKGLAQRKPWICFSLTIALLSFSGLPPTLGFFGKFFIFTEALKHQFFLLAIIGALGSIVSLYYYLRIIVYMYMHQPTPDTLQYTSTKQSALQRLITFPLAASLLVGTFFPESIIAYLKPIMTSTYKH